mgnify:CR=1 FL=1
MKGWLRMFVAEMPFLRDLPDITERPLPQVEVSIGRSVPAWLLRIVLVVATTSLVALAAHRSIIADGMAWALIVAAGLAPLFLPSAAVVHVVVVIAGVCLATSPHGPFDPLVFALIPLAYFAVRLVRWNEGVALGARVELAALARGLGRGVGFVGATLAFGAVVFLIAGHPSPVAVVAAGLALVALAWTLIARTDQ